MKHPCFTDKLLHLKQSGALFVVYSYIFEYDSFFWLEFTISLDFSKEILNSLDPKVEFLIIFQEETSISDN